MTGFSLVFSFLFLMFLLVRNRTLLTYFQQEEYDSKRFLFSFLRIGLIDVLFSLVLFGALIFQKFFGQAVLAVSFASLGGLIIGFREYKYNFKKKLVFTRRAKRIFVVSCILSMILAVGLKLTFKTSFLSFVLVLQVLPIIMILVNLSLQPLQNRINQRYIDEAKEKLSAYDGVKIGITGSFGKTTVKTILAYILSGTSNVFYSPGSINTVLGLTRHIRQRLQPAHDVFIAEMGAYGIGSIMRICKFIEPEYAIITSVGNAHSERFGSLENTAKAKSELVQWVCEHGTKAIIPVTLLRQDAFKVLYDQYPDKILTCGDDQSCDVQIIRKEKLKIGWQIYLSFNFINSDIHKFKLPLFGDHNHMNLCLCLALTAFLNPEKLSIARAVTSSIPQTPHRLQVKTRPGSYTLIDDAYNSNETGFKNAVEVMQGLTKKDGEGILVTPGIAELGDDHEAVHAELGRFCSSRCDQVFIVNSARIPSFVEALDKHGYLRYRMFESFDLAKAALSRMNLTENDVVLFENDLPDILETKRLL